MATNKLSAGLRGEGGGEPSRDLRAFFFLYDATAEEEEQEVTPGWMGPIGFARR